MVLEYGIQENHQGDPGGQSEQKEQCVGGFGIHSDLKEETGSRKGEGKTADTGADDVGQTCLGKFPVGAAQEGNANQDNAHIQDGVGQL